MNRIIDEPLLIPDDNRFVMFPIKHQDIWEMYLKAVGSFWITNEIDLSKDPDDWSKLTQDETFFISMILVSIHCFLSNSLPRLLIKES